MADSYISNEYLSGQINFTGLGSGTDFNSITEKLVEIEATHKTQLEAWKQTWELKVEALQALNSALLELKSFLSDMDTMNEFMVKSVSSSDSDAITATADSEAQVAVHSVEVGQLAKNAVITNDNGLASKTSSLTGSSAVFAYSYMGKEYTLSNVSAGTTLEGLKNIINTDPDNPGVRADIVYDGSEYFLQMRGLDLGSDATLSISASSTLSGFGSTDFTTTQQNQDSWIKVNGWPSGVDEWIKTDSNTIDSVIEGLTLNLKSVTSGVTLDVSTDTESIKENVQSYVQMTNEVRTLFLEATKFDEAEVEGSIMTGNYAVQLVSSKLKYANADMGKGFFRYDSLTDTGDVYSSLSQLGILTNADEGSSLSGMLELDEEMLDKALANDPDAVARLFSADGIGDQAVESGNFSYYSHITTVTEPGTYDVSYDIDASGKIINAYINGNKAKVDNSLHTITGMSDAEKGLVISINDLTPNTSGSGKVSLKQGKSGEIKDLLGELSSTDEGPLNIIQDNYEDIIANIEKKIEQEEVRLTAYAYNLKLKFARLEATLGNYDQINSSLENQIAQLE